VISPLELRRIFHEWRLKFHRIQAILKPVEFSDTDWNKFGRAIVGLLQRHGSSWSQENRTYWDLRWNLQDGGQLICQAESVEHQKISLVVAQMGGFVQDVDSYTWFWVEFDMKGQFIRDPYWVDGTWREALMTLLMPLQYSTGYYLSGSAPTPPSLMLGAEGSDSEAVSSPSNSSQSQQVSASHEDPLHATPMDAPDRFESNATRYQPSDRENWGRVVEVN
jgi:hypothetical protein